MFNKRSLIKPDGRNLHLYSRHKISDAIVATNPKHSGVKGEPHLRWHPLREEWVAYASHRQDRTFLPPKEYSPLAPTSSPEFPTELPAGDYDIAVFDNLFASLDLGAKLSPELITPTRPGNGHCEVIVFTQNADTNLGALPVDHIRLLLEVWADRYREIQRLSHIRYVLPFENRGVEVGVTLHHPHGQIYAYPFVPPLQARMLDTQRSFWQKNRRTLVGDLLEKEIAAQKRVIHQGSHTLAFIPVCARYPYEVWIAPLRPVSSLSEMNEAEIADFAHALKTVLMKYDALWQRPFPYLMTLLAAPSDGETHPEWHFHIEFSPPMRTRDKLKYLAGTELGAGMFVNDSLPEEKAEELRRIEVAFE